MIELPVFITNPNPLIYLSSNYLVLDLETTNEDYGDARNPNNSVVCGFAYGPQIGWHEVRSIADLALLAPILYSVDFVSCQNTKFEIKWLVRAGIQIERIVFYDTMLGDYCRAGNRDWKLDLDSLCLRYGVSQKHSFVHHLIQLGVCPSQLPETAVLAYCRNDVEITEQVMLKQRQILSEEGLLPVFFIRNLTTPLLADMEMKGMFLDKEEVLKIYNEITNEYSQILLQLNRITGGVNMGSPQQVAMFMYGPDGLKFDLPKNRFGKPIVGEPTKDWPLGLPKADEKTLPFLNVRTKRQQEFLDLKEKESELRKKITSYVERFMYVCGYEFQPLKEKKKLKGKFGSYLLQGDFNQSVTDTHRLSSSAPNLQNIDRKLKRVVTSRKKGWGIRNIDYAQLEFRVAGVLAQDKQALQDIRNNFDVHSYTASIIRKEDWEAAGSSKKTPEGKEIRDSIKPHTFKPLYGGVSGTDREREYYDAFRKKYPDITKMQEGWVDTCIRTEQLRTVTGLKFYFPGTKYNAKGTFVINSTNIKNYPVQMFATADISPIGSVLLWHNIKALELQSFFIAIVHDSSLLEECLEESPIIEKLAKQCLEQDIVPFFEKVIGYSINFPLEVESLVKSHW